MVPNTEALLKEAILCTQRLTELLQRLVAGAATAPSLSGAGPPVAPRKIAPKKVVPETLSEPRRLVLQAIVHYEKVAPRSIIDVRAVRMYLEQHYASVLARYNGNILSAALHYLRGLHLIRVEEDPRYRWRQYRLTPAGKRYSKKLNTMVPQEARRKEGNRE